MKIEIKHKNTGSVIFSMETDSIKLAVEAAVKAKVSLQSAYLQSADLQSANLQSADLQSADLWYANLRSADLQSANLQSAYLQSAYLQYANLQYANLQYANLRSADLQSANLQSANLDYSCWPLWCGSKAVKVDEKIALQLLAHFCGVDCDDKEIKNWQKKSMELAKTFHRAKEFFKDEK